MAAWNQRKKSQRKTKQRESKLFLIRCEGQTEENYFKSFPVENKENLLDIKGLGYNSESLVKKTIEEHKKFKKDKVTFSQVWCVFDKDEWADEQIRKAFRLAMENKIFIAYSNEAFELWYFLHFDYCDSRLSRDGWIEKLNERLDITYDKTQAVTTMMYDKLDDIQHIAIKNATRLYNTYEPLYTPEKDNPSTTIQCLVNELNEYCKNRCQHCFTFNNKKNRTCIQCGCIIS